MTETFVTLSDALEEMAPADLLLWKSGWNPISFLTGVFGRSGLSHAAQVKYSSGIWRGAGPSSPSARKGRPSKGVWEIQEIVQWHGGRRRFLREAVDQEPGRILWYAANAGGRWPEWRPQAAIKRFDELVGCAYGGWNLIKVGLQHVPILRLLLAGVLIRKATDDALDGSTPFCSQAVAVSCRAGGVDPVPHLADRYTEPADLQRSLFYGYRGTLVPDSMP
jgi:hypothetical protein